MLFFFIECPFHQDHLIKFQAFLGWKGSDHAHSFLYCVRGRVWLDFGLWFWAQQVFGLVVPLLLALLLLQQLLLVPGKPIIIEDLHIPKHNRECEFPERQETILDQKLFHSIIVNFKNLWAEEFRFLPLVHVFLEDIEDDVALGIGQGLHLLEEDHIGVDRQLPVERLDAKGNWVQG